MEKTTQDWVASKIPIRSDTFSRWIQRDVLPDVEQAYKIALALGISIEELVDGESGKAYIINWAETNGGKWQPPERFQSIYKDLAVLNDSDLENVADLAHARAERTRQADSENENLA